MADKPREQPETVRETIDRLKEQHPTAHPANCRCWICKSPGGI